MADESVNVRLPDGTAGTVPASQAAQLPEGTKRMTAAEVAAEKKAIALDKKYEVREGNLGQAATGRAAAFGAGAARGVTMGLSDFIASEYGGREYLNELKTALPGTSALGEVAGVGGLALATGGAGAAAEAGMAARLGSGALARIGAAGLRAGVEGFVQGAGSTLSEKSLSGEDITGESLVAGGLKGAAIGGGLGLGLGAAGVGVSKLRAPKVPTPTADAYETLAAGAYRTPAPGVGKALKEEIEGGAGKAASAEARATARATAEDVGPSVELEIGPAKQRTVFDQAAGAVSKGPAVAEEEAGKLKSVWERRHAVLQNEEETVASATRKFASSLDDELAASRKVDLDSFGDAKKTQMARLIDKTKLAEQSEAAIDWMTRAHALVDASAKDVNSGIGGKMVQNEWNGYMTKIAKAMEAGDSVALHTGMDNLKRWMGKQARFGRGPFGLSPAARMWDHLYQGEGGLMGVLESDVWGSAAAKAQREVNAATSAYMNEGDILRKKFTTQYGSDAGRPLYRADPAALSSHFGKLTDVAADLESEGVRNYLSARERMLDAMEKNYTFDAATTKALAEAKSSITSMRSTYETSVKDAALTNQVKKALEAERARSIGGLAGMVLDTATKPYTTLQRLASLEQQTQNIRLKITGGTRKIVAEAEPVASATLGGSGPGRDLSPPRSKGPGFFSGLLDSTKPVRDVTATGAAMGGAKLRAEYERRAEQLNRLKSDPAALSNRIAAALGPVTDGHPGVSAAARATAIRGLDFLASKMPPGREDPNSLQPHLERPRLSDAEASSMRRYMEAADDPTMVYEAARKGTLTREHVEAVKAVYPNLYEEMRVAVMESLVASRQKLPYSRRIQLGILLDIPTDKTLSPDFQKAIQETYQASGPQDAESPHPTLSRPLNVASGLQTATQAATEGAE